MSYAAAEDFLALVRNTSGGVRVLRMPGLDYVISAMARGGMFRLWVGQEAPTTQQATTVWFKPAVPSWASEGQVFLWDAVAGAYAAATPELWTALLNQPAAMLRQTGQVQLALFARIPSIPGASWTNFLAQYVGDSNSTDGSYTAVFVTAYAPINGAFWNLLDSYFRTSLGLTPTQSETELQTIWNNAATMPT